MTMGELKSKIKCVVSVVVVIAMGFVVVNRMDTMNQEKEQIVIDQKNEVIAYDKRLKDYNKKVSFKEQEKEYKKLMKAQELFKNLEKEIRTDRKNIISKIQFYIEKEQYYEAYTEANRFKGFNDLELNIFSVKAYEKLSKINNEKAREYFHQSSSKL